jgi:hypothetical protein
VEDNSLTVVYNTTGGFKTCNSRAILYKIPSNSHFVIARAFFPKQSPCFNEETASLGLDTLEEHQLLDPRSQ